MPRDHSSAPKKKGEYRDQAAWLVLCGFFAFASTVFFIAAFPTAKSLGIPKANDVPQSVSTPGINHNNIIEKKVGIGDISGIIKRLGSDDPIESDRAFNVLLACGPAIIPELSAAFSLADEYTRARIIGVLAGYKDPAIVPILGKIAQGDENVYVRSCAVDALGSVGDVSAVQYLAPILFDEHVDIKEKAAYSLGKIGSPEAVEGILDRMRDEQDPRVRSAIIVALGELKDHRAVAALSQELLAQPNKLMGDKLVQALDSIADASACTALEAYVVFLRGKEPHNPMAKDDWLNSVNMADKVLHRLQALSYS